MPALRTINENAVSPIRFVGESISSAALFVSVVVSSRANTAATIAALRTQLAHRVDRVRERKEPKPRFTPASRFLWVVLSTFLDGWEDLTIRAWVARHQSLQRAHHR